MNNRLKGNHKLDFYSRHSNGIPTVYWTKINADRFMTEHTSAIVNSTEIYQQVMYVNNGKGIVSCSTRIYTLRGTIKM